MGIVFDAATDGGNNGGSTTSLTFSHTATGANLLALVGFIGDNVGGADDVTSVTYGGTAMALAQKKTVNEDTSRYSYIYYLLAPSTGSQTVIITCGSSHYILGLAASYTGVKQTGFPDATAINSGGSITSLTSSITTIADNSWAFLLEEGYNGGPLPSASTGATRRTADAGLGTCGFFDSNGPITPAASYSMTTTRTSYSGHGISHNMISFAPATGGGAAVTYPQLERGIRGYCRGLAGMN